MTNLGLLRGPLAMGRIAETLLVLFSIHEARQLRHGFSDALHGPFAEIRDGSLYERIHVKAGAFLSVDMGYSDSLEELWIKAREMLLGSIDKISMIPALAINRREDGILDETEEPVLGVLQQFARFRMCPRHRLRSPREPSRSMRVWAKAGPRIGDGGPARSSVFLMDAGTVYVRRREPGRRGSSGL